MNYAFNFPYFFVIREKWELIFDTFARICRRRGRQVTKQLASAQAVPALIGRGLALAPGCPGTAGEQVQRTRCHMGKKNSASFMHEEERTNIAVPHTSPCLLSCCFSKWSFCAFTRPHTSSVMQQHSGNMLEVSAARFPAPAPSLFPTRSADHIIVSALNRGTGAPATKTECRAEHTHLPRDRTLPCTPNEEIQT